MPITNDWRFGRLANSLEECGFSSIGSSDNENPESPELLPNFSTTVRHDSSTVDINEQDCRRCWVGWGEEMGEKKETWRPDAVDTPALSEGRHERNCPNGFGPCSLLLSGHVLAVAPSGFMRSVHNQSWCIVRTSFRYTPSSLRMRYERSCGSRRQKFVSPMARPILVRV